MVTVEVETKAGIESFDMEHRVVGKFRAKMGALVDCTIRVYSEEAGVGLISKQVWTHGYFSEIPVICQETS